MADHIFENLKNNVKLSGRLTSEITVYHSFGIIPHWDINHLHFLPKENLYL